MKRIRIKKDISCQMTVKTNGQDASLEDASLSLIMVRPDKSREEITDVSITSNVLSFSVGHELQTVLGVYRFEVWRDKDTDHQSIADKVSAFQLVPLSTGEGGDDEPNLTTESVDLGVVAMSVGESGGAGIAVVDNLTSTSATAALSANQGRVLKGLVDGKADATHTHTKSQITDFAHTHTIDNVTGLSAALSGKANESDMVSGLAAKQDKLTTYTDNANSTTTISNRYVVLDCEEARIGNNAIATTSQIAGKADKSYVDTELNGKANTTHTHTKSQITDFAHTHTKEQITDFPSSMPASDVYSWAKESVKPSYTAAEVGAIASVSYASHDATTTITAADYTTATKVAVPSNLASLAITQIDALNVEVVLFVPSTCTVTLPSGTPVMGSIDGSKPYCISIVNGYCVIGNFDTI